MRNARRLFTALGAATVPVLLISGCSGGSSKSSATGPSSTASKVGSPSSAAAGTSPASTGGGSASTGALSKVQVRVVNLFDPKKAAGPALDIYDVQLTGQKATPVATDVAYGSTSSYFVPHFQPNSSLIELFALPTGEDPVTKQADAQSIGGAQDDGSHPQITVVLTADNGSALGTGPLDGLTNTSIVEKGAFNGSKAPVAPPPPAGKGEIMVDTTAAPDPNTGLYLIIDHSCDPPLNGDPNSKGLPYIFAADGVTPVSSFALFATSPGTHQVSVVAWTSVVTPTCAQLTAKLGNTSVDVSAGQQIEAYVYGTSDTDLHLALAPLRP